MTNQAILPRAELRAALALACKVAERRTAEPILSNVLIGGTASGAFIEATDLDITARFSFPGALADTALSLTIPAHTLKDIEKKAPAGDAVEVAAHDPDGDGDDATQRGAFNFGRVSFDLLGLTASGWPELKVEGKITADFTAPASALYNALTFCADAISTEETRYYLNGVYMHRASDSEGLPVLRFVATDGHRLRRIDIPAADIAGHFEDMPGIIVPRKTVLFLIDVLKRKGAPESIAVLVNSTKCRFTSGEVDIVTKLIDGTFPDYERVIPVRNPRRAVVDKAELVEAVKAVTCISSERGRAVKLEFSDAGLRLSVNNPDAGRSKTEMPCEWEGTPLEIGFNATYLMAEAANYAGETVTLWLEGSGSPVLIRGKDINGTALSVLMPMRV